MWWTFLWNIGNSYRKLKSFLFSKESSWSCSYNSWIYNYICNQCLQPLILCVRIPLRRGVLDSTLCDKVCQWLAAGRWFSPVTAVSSSKKTERHEIAETLLKGVLNAITITPFPSTVEFVAYILNRLKIGKICCVQHSIWENM